MIKIKRIPEETIAVMTYTGRMKNIEKFSSKFLEWLKSREIEISGPLFVIFYMDPLKEEGRYDIGFPVKKGTRGDNRINIAKIPEHSAVYTFYKFNERETAYNSLKSFIRNRNLDVIGFPREIYHTDYTEIQFPIIK